MRTKRWQYDIRDYPLSTVSVVFETENLFWQVAEYKATKETLNWLYKLNQSYPSKEGIFKYPKELIKETKNHQPIIAWCLEEGLKIRVRLYKATYQDLMNYVVSRRPVNGLSKWLEGFLHGVSKELENIFDHYQGDGITKALDSLSNLTYLHNDPTQLVGSIRTTGDDNFKYRINIWKSKDALTTIPLKDIKSPPYKATETEIKSVHYRGTMAINRWLSIYSNYKQVNMRSLFYLLRNKHHVFPKPEKLMENIEKDLYLDGKERKIKLIYTLRD